MITTWEVDVYESEKLIKYDSFRRKEEAINFYNRKTTELKEKPSFDGRVMLIKIETFRTENGYDQCRIFETATYF